MDKSTMRKLNLLVHLAIIDGDFHKSEKTLIHEFLIEKGFDSDDFNFLKTSNENLEDLHLIDDKLEIMYLAIKLIQADGIIDPRELEFCRKLALKLGFDPSKIDFFLDKQFTRTAFDRVFKIGNKLFIKPKPWTDKK